MNSIELTLRWGYRPDIQTIIGVLWAILRPFATMAGSSPALRRGPAGAGQGLAAAGRWAGG